MVKTWMSEFIKQYGEPIPPYDDLPAETLLAFGTMRMLTNYFYKMKEQLLRNHFGREKWTFACQVPDLDILKDFLTNKTTISLMGSNKAPYVDDDNDDVIECTSSEFLFTFLIMRGDQVSHKLVSRIPRDINKVFSGAMKSHMIKSQQNSQRLDRLNGGRNLSNRAAVRAAKGQCNMCDSVEGTLKCSGCHVVHYCSKDHQVRDWPYHKVFCKIHQGVMADKSATEVCIEEKISETDRLMNITEAQTKQMSINEALESLNDGRDALSIVVQNTYADICEVTTIRR